VYFTLAVTAATAEGCEALAGAAVRADPRVMPIPGPARVAWRAPGGRAAILHWGEDGLASTARDGHADSGGADPRSGLGASHAGTIWAEGDAVRARTGLARVDPVYLAEMAGAAVVSDRASWAAEVTGRLRDPDPVMIGAFLSLGYPVGGATPFRGVRALGGDQALRAAGGRFAVTRAGFDGDGPGGALLAPGGTTPPFPPGPSGALLAPGGTTPPFPPGPSGAERVAEALTEVVRPLREAAAPVVLSLTGGKDSRLVVAALTAARVPFAARTHGFAGHPDVVLAGLIAERLGVEHTVTEPAAAGTPDEAGVLGRLRATVLVSDGMLSAFENVGRPDPPAPASGGPAEAGGHGGELLRGGYAQAAWRTPAALGAAAGAVLFRRMTTRRLSLLGPGPLRAYLASLAGPAAALVRGPLTALDDFYLVNRAGRWSAAARQAYLIRSPLVQPLFADPVVRAARAVPLADRVTDRLHRDVLGALCPELLGLPLAGTPWHGEPRTPATVLTAPRGTGAADWRRSFGQAVERFLRGYVLDHDAASPLFGILRRQAAERLLCSPQADPQGTWALATLAALLSGDWLNAREPAGRALVSRDRT
jgi:asparagine synthase (glutamine-hydrolysing)